LFKEFKKIVIDKGSKRIKVRTFIKNNEAIKFYQKNRFNEKHQIILEQNL